MNIKYIILSAVIGLINTSVSFCIIPQETQHAETQKQTHTTQRSPWIHDQEESEPESGYPYLGIFNAHNQQEFLDLIKKTFNR